MKRNKRNIIISITSILLVIILLLGLTYAYYRTRIIGNKSTDPSIRVQLKKMEIVYEDGNSTLSTEGKIEPGFTATKNFSVKNTGNETAVFSVVIDNVENTFNKGIESRGEYNDWEFVLIQDGTEVKSGEITTKTKQLILNDIRIASDVTTNFSLKITYKNLEDVDQSDDMGSILSLRVNIDEKIVGWDAAKEGTLLYALKNDNEVVEPMSVPGKEAAGANNQYKVIEKDITETEIVGYTNHYSNYLEIDDYSVLKDRYIAYSTEYEITSSGEFNLINAQVVKYSEIYDLVNSQNQIIYISSLEGSYYSDEEDYTNLSIIYQPTDLWICDDEDHAGNGYLELKGSVYETETISVEAILSATEDDYGTSYYFRGEVENNYVNFSGKCWKIVRIQGNGITKLILADSKHTCDDIDYNFEIDKTYGVQWTIDNLSDVNSNLIETEWCYDTSVKSEECNEDGYCAQTYNSFDRSVKGEPTLKCDMTGLNNSTTIKQSSKYGQLTSDEMMFAGASMYSESRFYLNFESDSDFELIGAYNEFYHDPESYFTTGSQVPTLDKYGYFSWTDDAELDYRWIVPVIAIKTDAMLDASVSGQNGTRRNPYVIS